MGLTLVILMETGYLNFGAMSKKSIYVLYNGIEAQSNVLNHTELLCNFVCTI